MEKIMNSWNVFKKSTPLYLCNSKESAYLNIKNIIIAKSGIENQSCNFAIIENDNAEEQKNIIEQYFDCDGLIFSLEKNKNKIDSWASDLGFVYFGRIPLMNKKQIPINFKLNENQDIRVEKVVTKDLLKDFVKIFSDTRKISFEEGMSMFPEIFFNSEYLLYVSYYLEEPAGAMAIVITQDGAIVVDVDVKEKFRNLGILKAISEKSFFDITNKNIYDYSVLPTSQFAYNVVSQYGFVAEGNCDVWKKYKKGEKS